MGAENFNFASQFFGFSKMEFFITASSFAFLHDNFSTP